VKNNSYDETRSKVNIANIYNNITNSYDELMMLFKNSKEKIKDLITTNFDLGVYHFKQGNISDAIFRFKLVIYFRPTKLIAYYYLAKCMIIKNNPEKAISILKKSIENGYGCEESIYLLATLDRSQAHPQHIPITIIENYFDNIALESKKSNSSEADHSNSKILFEICAELIDKENKSITNIIDLGCGNGIASLYFKEKFPNSNISGIDLSLEMINLSKKLNIKQIPVFDNLLNTQMIDHLSNTNKKYDLIIASDSLHYQKDLTTILTLAKKTLNDDGIMAFSIEKSNSVNVDLNSSMKNYCFNRQLIETSIKEAKFNQLHMSEHKINDSENYWYVVISPNNL
jgi:predicted TPR repeat methyltransferase